MNNSTTLNEALNRQFVALATQIPLESGLFDCKRSKQIGSNRPSISFKPFEKAYPISRGTAKMTLEIR